MPLAAFIRFRFMEPEASTAKMMRDPAYRAIFLFRTSLCSMKTPCPSFLVRTAYSHRVRIKTLLSRAWRTAQARQPCLPL